MQKEIIEYKGYRIEAEQDEYAMSPAEWGDSDRFVVGYHSREFWVPVSGFEEGRMRDVIAGGRYEDGSKDEDAISIARKYHVFELDAYIHSGVALKLVSKLPEKSEGHDRSFFGFVLIAKSEARTRAGAEKAARALIETWNAYLCGSVYQYATYDPDGELESSCGGFYEYDVMIQECKAEIDSAARARDAKRATYASYFAGSGELFDNGGKTLDRYTAIYNGDVYGFSSDPSSPQGFNQYCGSSEKIDRAALGKRVAWDNAPVEIQEAIINRIIR